MTTKDDEEHIEISSPKKKKAKLDFDGNIPGEETKMKASDLVKIDGDNSEGNVNDEQFVTLVDGWNTVSYTPNNSDIDSVTKFVVFPDPNNTSVTNAYYIDNVTFPAAGLVEPDLPFNTGPEDSTFDATNDGMIIEVGHGGIAPSENVFFTQ